MAKPLSEKDRKKREKALKKELEGPYKQWLTVDVAYIITDEERQAFKRLNTDEEKQQFIEQFWLRRDPTPDTEENEFKEEHYRRIAYANERFASGIPGWKTDRGRIYITFGPPDENESHPSGGTYERPMEEGGGSTSTYPFEVALPLHRGNRQRYQHRIRRPHHDRRISYDHGSIREGCAAVRARRRPHDDGADGHDQQNERFNRTDGTHLGVGNNPMPASMNQFERLEQFAKLQQAPKIKFKDLEAAISSTVRYNTLPMRVRTDFIPVTPHVHLQQHHSAVRSQGSAVCTEGRRLEGDHQYLRANQFHGAPYGERVRRCRNSGSALDDAAASFARRIGVSENGAAGSRQVPPERRGERHYCGNMTNYEVALDVPRFEEDKLAASSIILADLIEKVPTKSIGTGQFVIGASKVRPRLSESFSRDEKLGIYVQLYNFEADEATKKPNGTIDYEIVKNGSNQKVFEFREDVGALHGSATQFTVEKLLPLKTFEPGSYTLRMKVVDKVRNQTLTPSSTFTVE